MHRIRHRDCIGTGPPRVTSAPASPWGHQHRGLGPFGDLPGVPPRCHQTLDLGDIGAKTLGTNQPWGHQLWHLRDHQPWGHQLGDLGDVASGMLASPSLGTSALGPWGRHFQDLGVPQLQDSGLNVTSSPPPSSGCTPRSPSSPLGTVPMSPSPGTNDSGVTPLSPPPPGTFLSYSCPGLYPDPPNKHRKPGGVTGTPPVSPGPPRHWDRSTDAALGLGGGPRIHPGRLGSQQGPAAFIEAGPGRGVPRLWGAIPQGGCPPRGGSPGGDTPISGRASCRRWAGSAPASSPSPP